MSYALIGDGYDERAYLTAEPRLYPDVRFGYRPLTVEERALLLAENARLTTAEAARNTARVVAAKIQNWDIRDKDGKAVKVSADALLSLKPRLYERILSVVMGLEAGDEDTTAKPTRQEASQSLADKLEAAARSVPVGEVREERNAKN